MKSEQLGVVAIALVAASFLCAPTTPASANPVLPGGTVTPDLFGAISGSVLATTGTVPLTSVPPSFMSTYVAEVVADAGRGGLLDFILQTTNSSPASGDALGRVTLTSFAGFATDVGTAMSAGGLAGGTAPPVNITRSSAGNVIGFNFAPGVLSPGTTSEVLVVETNATAFVPGTVLETDGGAASGPGFAPVPAPSIDRGVSVLLAVGGLLFGAELFERGRKRRSPGAAAA